MRLTKRGRNRQAWRTGWVALVALAVLCAGSWAVMAQDAGQDASVLTAPPGGGYQKVSDLVPLPEFIPGMGILYVRPETLPAGPFLGYDRDGKLVHITYMVPLSELDARVNFDNLETVAGGAKVDHVSITYNPGHPGVPSPHYHVTLWLIDAEAAAKLQ